MSLPLLHDVKTPCRQEAYRHSGRRRIKGQPQWVFVMPDLIPDECGIFDRHPVFNDGHFPLRIAQFRSQLRNPEIARDFALYGKQHSKRNSPLRIVQKLQKSIMTLNDLFHNGKP